MEVDRSVDGFSPNLDRCLGVNHHSLGLFGGGTDYCLSDNVLLVRIGQGWFKCCAGGSEHPAEGHVILLTSAIAVSESYDLIAI